jgi:hypothetical protein
MLELQKASMQPDRVFALNRREISVTSILNPTTGHLHLRRDSPCASLRLTQFCLEFPFAIAQVSHISLRLWLEAVSQPV